MTNVKDMLDRLGKAVGIKTTPPEARPETEATPAPGAVEAPAPDPR